MNTHFGLTNWKNALNPLAEFRREFDHFFAPWETPVESSTGVHTGERSFLPVCEVEETDINYTLSLEMPGIKKEAIRIETVDRRLTISGEHRREKENHRGYSERRFGRFQRSFELPVGTDTARIEANYEDGVLRLVIPKVEVVKPRQIPIGPSGKMVAPARRVDTASAIASETKAAS